MLERSYGLLVSTRRAACCAAGISLLCASTVFADVVYDVTVDSSSISGTAGSLDFNFNSGPLVTQAATLQILDFTGGTLVTGPCVSGGPCPTGDVSGTLPGTVSFDNGSAFNDYFQDFTYGSSLSFELDFGGPAINSPDGISTSGSTFAFSMFSDAAGMMPALTTDLTDGYAATIDVNLDGSTTVNDFSIQTTISQVPEPGSLALLSTAVTGMGLLAVLQRRRERKRGHP
jgi:hypothetical protein